MSAVAKPSRKADYSRLTKAEKAELERLMLPQVLLEPGNEKRWLKRYFSDMLEAELEDFHMRLIDTALSKARGLVLFPAGHGKTTLISCLLPILEVIRNPNIRISVIGKNDNEATAIMGVIKSQMEDNELLISDYGPFRPPNGDPMRVWTTEAISVAKRTRMGKEHTVTVFGAGSRQILGWRSDWVICDDVVTEKNSATEDQRIKHRDWFTTCVETSPQKRKAGVKGGRITTVGTMFHPRDLYASITEKTDRNGVAIYASHREDAIRDYTEQKTLWPEVWSWEDMMDERSSIGTLSFNKRYRNMPVDESQQPFREDWLRGKEGNPGCLDKHRRLGEYDPDWRIYQSFDPAIGKTASAAFCGHIVFGVDMSEPRKRHLIEIHREQLTIPQQRDKIIETHMRYPNMVMSITEENAYQAGLNQIINERCEQLGITLRMEGHTTGRNKQDPEIGIPSLSPVVENGDLRIPYGNPQSIRVAEMFMTELIEYPFFKYSDMLMALWFGHLKLQTGMPLYESFNRLKPKSRYRKQKRNTVRNPFWDAPKDKATTEWVQAGQIGLADVG